MPDLWDDGEPSTEDFELPGDAEFYENVSEQAAEEPEGRTDAVTDEEAEAADAASGRPRDERGRYVSEKEPEPEPEPEGEPDPVEGLLAKYGGDERKALEAALEAQSVIGRQAQELGELRAQQAQLAAYMQAQEQARSQQQAGPIDWETLIDDDPAYATQLAYQQGNEPAYRAAAQAWEEVSPGTPNVWYDNQQMKQAMGQMSGAVSSQHQVEQARQMAQRADALIQQYPDLPDALDEMSQIAPRFPYELRALVSGTPEEALAATESLYLKTKTLKSEGFAQRAQEIARSQTQEEMRVREGASVASASRTHTEPPLSAEERIAADWGTRDKMLAEGWNV